MEFDDLIDLQWELQRANNDAPGEDDVPSPPFGTGIRHPLYEEEPHAGHSADVKRPLSEKNCNVNSQEVLNNGRSEYHLPKCRVTFYI